MADIKDNEIYLQVIVERSLPTCETIIRGIYLGSTTVECNLNKFVWKACLEHLSTSKCVEIKEREGHFEEWEDGQAWEVEANDLEGYVDFRVCDGPLNLFNGELDDCRELAKYVKQTLVETEAEQG